MSEFEITGNGGHTDTQHSVLTHPPALHRKVVPDYSPESIASSIDSTLCQLGDDSKQALLFHIRMQFHIQQDDFMNEPEVLGRALARILGHGANTLERIMVQHMESFASDTHTAEQFAVSMMTATRSELSRQDS
jgi:hypothetical protein